jgi:hypothetical protein
MRVLLCPIPKSPNMNVAIHLMSKPDPTSSTDLNSLRTILSNEMDCSVDATNQASEPGVKDGGLAIALQIAGVALSSVSTLIAAINFWRTQRPRYLVSATYKRHVVPLDAENDVLRSIFDALPDEEETLELSITSRDDA